MKKSKVLLVSAIIGAVWSIGFIWLALWFFREIFILPDDPSQALKDVFNNIIHFGSVDSETKSGILIILYSFIGTVLSIKATVSNFTAYLKNERKKCLHAGILYITALNLPSAILCFVEYFDMAKPVKNKSLLISVLFSIPAIICILLLYNISDFITDDDVAITFFFTVTIIVAALFNILAIRTEKKIFVFVAAILYTIGLASVPSAVIRYINFAPLSACAEANFGEVGETI
jgi:hypothetical protein